MSSYFRNTYSTPTVLGRINQLQGVSDVNYVGHKNTTLNAKYNVLPDYDVPPEIPSLKYFGIGINGYFVTNDDKLTQPYIPAATNMDLYKPIPFRVRIANSSTDLTPEEREQYRMRTIMQIGGIDYACYWLKKIQFQENNTLDVSIVSQNGESVSEYDLDAVDGDTGYHPQLNPIPDDNITPSIDPSENNIITIGTTGSCIVTGEEVLEAIDIIYGGNNLLAKISEIGYYTGCDVPLQDNSKEAAYVQLAGHRCMNGYDMMLPDTVYESKVSFRDGNLIAAANATTSSQ